jgi:hypothetical protein
MVWRSATCFPTSSTDRAATSTIAPRTHIDRRGVGSGRCNGSNRPSRPMASSPLTRSFMAISIHADTSCQPPHIARSDPRRSMSGSRRRALGIRRDRQGNLPLGPASPSEVNVTIPDPHTAGCHPRAVHPVVLDGVRRGRSPANFDSGSVTEVLPPIPKPASLLLTLLPDHPIGHSAGLACILDNPVAESAIH